MDIEPQTIFGLFAVDIGYLLVTVLLSRVIGELSPLRESFYSLSPLIQVWLVFGALLGVATFGSVLSFFTDG
jgi:hypothetical protein